MKKLLFALLAALILTLPAFAYTVPDDTIVYVTNTGTRYHRENCTHTAKSAHPLTIKSAEEKGYSPCSRCNPHIRTGEYVSDWDGESGGSSSGSSSSKGTASSAAASAPSSNSAAVPEPSSKFLEFLLGASIPIGIVILSVFLPQQIHRAIQKRRDAAEKERRFLQAKEEYTALYGGKSAEELAGIPPGVEIGPDGLPRVAGEEGWGNAYTFYISLNGRAFHRKCGCSGARSPEHAVYCTWRNPCRLCWPDFPDLTWYEEYLKIHAIKKKYDID